MPASPYFNRGYWPVPTFPPPYWPGGVPVAPPELGIPLGGWLDSSVLGIPVGGRLRADGVTSAVYPDLVTVNGVTLAASVTRNQATGVITHRDEFDEKPVGVSAMVVYFATDPGIDDADVILIWINDIYGPMRLPVYLKALGAAIPPGGGGTQWAVDCEFRGHG